MAFWFSPRLYKLSSQRRHSSYGARFSARGDCLVSFPIVGTKAGRMQERGRAGDRFAFALAVFPDCLFIRSEVLRGSDMNWSDAYVLGQVAVRGMNGELLEE